MVLDKDKATIAFLNTHIQPMKYDELYEQSKAEFISGYALGVAEERERIAKQFEEAGWHPYVELIRKGGE